MLASDRVAYLKYARVIRPVRVTGISRLDCNPALCPVTRPMYIGIASRHSREQTLAHRVLQLWCKTGQNSLRASAPYETICRRRRNACAIDSKASALYFLRKRTSLEDVFFRVSSGSGALDQTIGPDKVSWPCKDQPYQAQQVLNVPKYQGSSNNRQNVTTPGQYRLKITRVVTNLIPHCCKVIYIYLYIYKVPLRKLGHGPSWGGCKGT